MFTGIIGTIISGFLGGGLGTITAEIGKWQERKLTAETSEAKLEADQEIAYLNAKRDILLAENGAGGIRAWIRPLFALPFVIYLWTLIVYDKVLGDWTHHSTDPLSPELWSIGMLVIGAYFVDRTVKAVGRMFTG